MGLNVELWEYISYRVPHRRLVMCALIGAVLGLVIPCLDSHVKIPCLEEILQRNMFVYLKSRTGQAK